MLYGMWASSTALAITAEDKVELERIVRSGRTEQRHALRARIILGAAEGRSNNALAKELKTSRPTIVDWRARYVEGGVKALYEDRPRGKSFEAVARSKAAEIVAKTQSPPANATHWSCRRMAETCGVSKASVQRIWQANGLKPHLVKTFKLSNDPHFIEKLRMSSVFTSTLRNMPWCFVLTRKAKSRPPVQARGRLLIALSPACQ